MGDLQERSPEDKRMSLKRMERKEALKIKGRHQEDETDLDWYWLYLF